VRLVPALVLLGLVAVGTSVVPLDASVRSPGSSRLARAQNATSGPSQGSWRPEQLIWKDELPPPSTARPRTAPVPARPGAPAPESVIGSDDRKTVSPTTPVPWRNIASLEVAFGSQLFVCTGFFIGSQTLATAGHCLVNDSGNATQVVVKPARDGPQLPYGQQTASSWATSAGWAASFDPFLDYGVITLPTSVPGNQTGWLRFAGANGAALVGATVNVAGYPGQDLTHLKFDSDVVTGRTSSAGGAFAYGQLHYTVDTSGGQSGSPVWGYNGTGRVVSAIHTLGGGSWNSGVLITPAVATELNAAGGEAPVAPLVGGLIAESLPVIGGKNLSIRAGSAILNWNGGNVQDGYAVWRASDNTILTLLPAGATSFTDTTAPSGGCYAVIPVAGSPLSPIGISDVLCYFASVSGTAPTNFTLQLNQSQTASFNWTPAGLSTSYWLLPIDRPPIQLLGSATSAQHNTGGLPTCYVLAAIGQDGNPTGNTDILCAFPGVSSLGA
jgi:glutamyl endopeptidase